MTRRPCSSFERQPMDGEPSISAHPANDGPFALKFPSLSYVRAVPAEITSTGWKQFAQLISRAVIAQDQFDCIVCFVDNIAAEHATQQRYVQEPEPLLVSRGLLGVGCPSELVR